MFDHKMQGYLKYLNFKFWYDTLLLKQVKIYKNYDR